MFNEFNYSLDHKFDQNRKRPQRYCYISFRSANKSLTSILGEAPRNVFGKDDELPGLSDEERGLLDAQIDAIRQGLGISENLASIQKFLQPILFEEAGFKPIMENGEIVGFEPTGKGERAEQLATLRSGFLERAQAALAGDLPIDPALMRDLKERESAFEKQLVQEFGSKEGAFKSTSGQQFFSRFGESQEIVKDKARRADLTMATQLGLQTGAAEEDLLRSRLFSAQSIAGFVTGQGFNQAAQGFGSAQQSLAQNRQFLAGIQENRRSQAQSNLGVGVGAAAAFFA